MTGPNLGDAHVDVTELLTALAAAERKALDAEGAARSNDYRLGLAEAYADVQALVRNLAGWPVEAESDRTT